MKRIFAIAALLVAPVAAHAASAPSAAPPTATPAFSWTGVYGGLNGGYAFGADRSYDVLIGGLTPNPAEAGSFHSSGGLAGGEIGVNYQTGDIVFGFETDIDWSQIQGSYIDDPWEPSGQSRDTGTVEWFGTARGRIGVAQDRLLLFATGGLAYGGIKVGISNYSGDGSPYLTDRQSTTGWTVGGGAEYAATNNWTIKAEYLYVDLSAKTFTFVDPSDYCGCLGPDNVVATAKGKTEFSVLRLGVNYKF